MVGDVPEVTDDSAKLIRYGLELVAKELARLTDAIRDVPELPRECICPACKTRHAGNYAEKAEAAARELGLDRGEVRKSP